MIFLIIESIHTVDVVIYKSIEQLTNMIEWQDIFEGMSIILDEDGNTYKWDSSKKKEYGSVYGYTLTVEGVNKELIAYCKRTYEDLGKPNEFELNKKEINKYK